MNEILNLNDLKKSSLSIDKVKQLLPHTYELKSKINMV